MGYKPRKWPTYAIDALEDALSLLEDIERDMKRVEAAGKAGDKVELANAGTDVRVKAVKAHSTLIQGKTGDYRRMEKS